MRDKEKDALLEEARIKYPTGTIVNSLGGIKNASGHNMNDPSALRMFASFFVGGDDGLPEISTEQFEYFIINRKKADQIINTYNLY